MQRIDNINISDDDKKINDNVLNPPITEAVNQPPTYFNNLPKDLILEIASYIHPEDITTLSLTTKNLMNAVSNNVFWKQTFWKEKFKRHFPHVFPQIANQENTNWCDEFQKTYKDEYETLDEAYKILPKDIQERFSLKTIKKLFSWVKEGNDEVLRTKQIPFCLFNLSDQNGTSLLQWAQRKKAQTVLNYFFEKALEEYSVGNAIDPAKLDEKGRTILHWAVLCNKPEFIDALILQGCDINATFNGRTAIHIACDEGYFDIVKLILLKQPDLLNQTDSLGQTPILWAASRGHTAIVRYLAEQGAELTQATNNGDHHGYTALHWAAENGHTECVEVLIEHNAQLDVAINASISSLQAIHLACKEGHLDIVILLLQKQPNLLNQTDNFGQTPILWAASRGHADIVRYLAEQGADLTQATNNNNGDHHGYTALHWATEKGHTECVEVLIEHNARLDVAINAGAGLQAIHLACKEDHLDIVKLLLQKQPNLLNQTDIFGQTPILWAASRGHAAIVRYLAEQGADLTQATNTNNGDHHGYTALHWATEKGHTECVEVLIEHNARLDVAINAGVGLKAIHLACHEGHLDIVKLLLQKQPDLLNQTDRAGQTPIIWAASRGHFLIVGYLAEQGADLTQATNNNGEHHGYTALHWAVTNGHTKVVQVLLYKGANLSAINNNGDTPLHIATQSGYSTIARILIKKKADIFALNRQEKKPIDLAPNDKKLEMELLNYSRTVKNKPNSKHNKLLTFFGVSRKKKMLTKMLPATKALKKVYFDGAPTSTLEDHKKTLEHSKFKPLYRNLKR